MCFHFTVMRHAVSSPEPLPNNPHEECFHSHSSVMHWRNILEVVTCKLLPNALLPQVLLSLIDSSTMVVFHHQDQKVPKCCTFFFYRRKIKLADGERNGGLTPLLVSSAVATPPAPTPSFIFTLPSLSPPHTYAPLSCKSGEHVGLNFPSPPSPKA